MNHGFYDTNSVLRALELLMDLPPMTQYDAVANPIGFDAARHSTGVWDTGCRAPSRGGGGGGPGGVSVYRARTPRRLNPRQTGSIHDSSKNLRILRTTSHSSMRKK